jgi:hypothetical protein
MDCHHPLTLDSRLRGNDGDTVLRPEHPIVMPAQAGIHDRTHCWIPAFTGMTAKRRQA